MIGVGQQQMGMLDILKVEQRLKYFGFPAISYRDGGIVNNVIQDFSVDGKFGEKEKLALKLFEKVIRYGDLPETQRFYMVSDGADGVIEASGSERQTTIDWFNAYNAPHWMQFFSSAGNGRYVESSNALLGWKNNQVGTTLRNVELYGTSWMRDLMAAKKFGTSTLVQSGTEFNGSVDANHGITPKGFVANGIHSSHDVGMAMDLGFQRYIFGVPANKKTGAPASGPAYDQSEPLKINIPASSVWSLANAVSYVEKLTQAGLGVSGNNQAGAIKEFLSLYTLVRSDTAATSGTWDFLYSHIQNEENEDKKKEIRDALFGDGTREGALISKVLFGRSGANPFLNMKAVLAGLGVFTGRDDVNHFHIYLKPPEILPIGGRISVNSLVSDDFVLNQSGLIGFNRNNDGDSMLIVDAPYISFDAGYVEKTRSPDIGAYDYQFDFCSPIQVFHPGPAASKLSFLWKLKSAFYQKYGQDLDLKKMTFVVVSNPSSGEVFSEKGLLHYKPNADFEGEDSVVVAVTYENIKIKVLMKIVVTDNLEYGGDSVDDCMKYKGNLLRVGDFLSVSEGWQLVQLVSGAIEGYEQFRPKIIFYDFANQALGETRKGSTGAITIALDINAAGHGWYFDWQGAGDDWLPTSNPYEWMARPGSAAEGRMDFLSVFLHEYGHALGLEHSHDSHDLMAATLQPGVRRLPSAEELALFQSVNGMAEMAVNTPQPYSPFSPFTPDVPLPVSMSLILAGVRRRFGNLASDGQQILSQDARGNTAVQYEVAANPVLRTLDGQGNGWEHTGEVDFADNTATLKEVVGSQTRLNQIFTVGENDRYLIVIPRHLSTNACASACMARTSRLD